MLAAVPAADVCWLHALLTYRLTAAHSLGMAGAYMSCWSLNSRADTDASYQMLSLCGQTVVHVALLVSVFVAGELEPHVYQS
jgi:hypothetical protein